MAMASVLLLAAIRRSAAFITWTGWTLAML